MLTLYAIDSDSDREEESLSAVLNKKKKRVCGPYKQTIHVVASKMHLQLCFEILLLFEFVMKGVWNSIFFSVFKCSIIFFCFIERCTGKDFIIYNFQIANVFDDDSNDSTKGNLWFNLNF